MGTKTRKTVREYAAEIESLAVKLSHFCGDSPQGRGWFALERSWREPEQRWMWQAGLRNCRDYEGDGWILFEVDDDPTKALEKVLATLLARADERE